MQIRTLNFPRLCSNISLSPAYGVYASHPIRYVYARACSTYDQILCQGKLLQNRLLQWFQQSHLKAAFRNFNGRKNDLVYPFELSLNQMLSSMFQNNFKPFLYTDLNYGLLRLSDLHHWLTAYVTGQQGMLTPSST